MISKEVLKRIELVIFDLDGSILDDNGNLNEDTILLINKLNRIGIKFSIATGRLHNAVLNFAEALSIDIPLITLDGTLIKNPKTNQIIFKSNVPEKVVNRALELADKYLLKIALCHDDAIYYTEYNSLIPNLLEKFGTKYELIDSYNGYLNDTLEIIMTGDYSEMVRQTSNKLSFPYTFGIRTSFYKSQKHGGIYYLEVRKMGSTKGKGLKRLCRHLKIKLKNTAVIGDWYNDMSLFETDALKIAVANAVPEIKKMADMVTKETNNNGGINEFLNLILEAKS